MSGVDFRDLPYYYESWTLRYLELTGLVSSRRALTSYSALVKRVSFGGEVLEYEETRV